MRVFVPCTDWATARASEVLPVPGDVLEQHVTVAEHRGQHELDDVALAQHRPLDVVGDLAERLREPGRLLLRDGHRVVVLWSSRVSCGQGVGAGPGEVRVARCRERRVRRREAPRPARSSSTATVMPSTRTAPTGTAQVSAVCGSSGARRVVVAQPGVAEGDRGLAARGVCSMSRRPRPGPIRRRTLCTLQLACTWYGALPARGVTVAHGVAVPQSRARTAPGSPGRGRRSSSAARANSTRLRLGTRSAEVGCARTIHSARPSPTFGVGIHDEGVAPRAPSRLLGAHARRRGRRRRRPRRRTTTRTHSVNEYSSPSARPGNVAVAAAASACTAGPRGRCRTAARTRRRRTVPCPGRSRSTCRRRRMPS